MINYGKCNAILHAPEFISVRVSRDSISRKKITIQDIHYRGGGEGVPSCTCKRRQEQGTCGACVHS